VFFFVLNYFVKKLSFLSACKAATLASNAEKASNSPPVTEGALAWALAIVVLIIGILKVINKKR
jgi:hypothetical protein